MKHQDFKPLSYHLAQAEISLCFCWETVLITVCADKPALTTRSHWHTFETWVWQILFSLLEILTAIFHTTKPHTFSTGPLLAFDWMIFVISNLSFLMQRGFLALSPTVWLLSNGLDFNWHCYTVRWRGKKGTIYFIIFLIKASHMDEWEMYTRWKCAVNTVCIVTVRLQRRFSKELRQAEMMQVLISVSSGLFTHLIFGWYRLWGLHLSTCQCVF